MTERWDCLIVDDETALTEAAAEYCNLMGIRTKGVTSCAQCEAFLAEHCAQVILLDINLEDGSGFDLCRRLRQTTDVPILFLSARSSDDDKIASYALGGDDYIQKPCSLSVLAAKVKAVLKRCQARSGYSDGSLCVDPDRRRVSKDGRELRLTPTEYRLLCCLVRRADHTVSKQELFEEVWQDALTGDSTLNVHIRHLREHIEKDPARPTYIVTVHGVGYRFVSRC
ncbi:MAG: response regulator transcription factor [Clostridia bacterium]|nr:response regulator transcription factor [Clostridia bacterium]